MLVKCATNISCTLILRGRLGRMSSDHGALNHLTRSRYQTKLDLDGLLIAHMQQAQLFEYKHTMDTPTPQLLIRFGRVGEISEVGNEIVGIHNPPKSKPGGHDFRYTQAKQIEL